LTHGTSAGSVNMSRAVPLWAAAFVAGCGALFATSQTGCSGGSAGTAAAVQPAKTAVAAFLDAVERGDDAAARGMLTKVAAAKTQEMGISVAPPRACHGDLTRSAKRKWSANQMIS